jgi:hypothetical protein
MEVTTGSYPTFRFGEGLCPLELTFGPGVHGAGLLAAFAMLLCATLSSGLVAPALRQGDVHSRWTDPGRCGGVPQRPAAESEGSYLSPVCIAIMALAFGSALAVPVMLTLWRTGRRGLALVALLGVACSESYGFQLSAERLPAARDQRAQQVKTANATFELAQKALADLERDRKVECKSGFGKRCTELKAWEDKQRAALASTHVPRSHSLIADATGLPAWLVEIAPAMAFSTGPLMLGLVLVGFGGHSIKEEAPAAPETMPDETEQVVSWVREYRRRHGRDPKIPEVQQVFKGLPKTTAWRRIRAS